MLLLSKKIEVLLRIFWIYKAIGLEVWKVEKRKEQNKKSYYMSVAQQAEG